ncbi:RNA polymerase sigma factor sigV [Asticcacaulis biprosthecium C19]|uniref:RNA polymerase sigma factor sigV n=1 Tax=Asticcacaulis biprosthecium C19 TaxID=715226 RepID=F4QK84_9CAUL|nr:RNA polymerase sigma factor sigV [Asticcacaulis biprosthecium C19]
MDSRPAGATTAAMTGDREAILSLIVACQPDLRRYARRSCRTASDAEDAVQETLWVLYRKAPAIRQAAAFWGWLFTIVRRTCLRLAKAAHMTVSDDALLEVAAVARPDADLRLDLASGIESLPQNYREVLLLRDIEELTIDEISTRLGASREAVKARLHRARTLMRDYLTR